MKKALYILPILVLCSFFGVQDFVTTKVSSHLTMDLDAQLSSIPDEDSTAQFKSNVATMALYQSADEDANLSVKLFKESRDTLTKFKNRDANKAKDRDLFLEKMFRKSSVINQYDDVEFYQDTLMDINGKQTIVFEYTGTTSYKNQNDDIVQKKIYSYYQLMYSKNKTYIITFYCPEDRKSDWQSSAKTMMQSIKIRG